ncbi:MAG: hypothetical protein RML12_06935 [Xanthomonadales bacterium]|nr:hypothetical protein [Xanthomonadales bacterium]
MSSSRSRPSRWRRGRRRCSRSGRAAAGRSASCSTSCSPAAGASRWRGASRSAPSRAPWDARRRRWRPRWPATGGRAPTASAASAIRRAARRIRCGPSPSSSPAPFPGQRRRSARPQAWLAERKWDGIRAQLIGRRGAVALWSRGGERIEERFPELARAMAGLGREAALDGEILAWSGDRPLPFAQLQRRLQRRRPGALEREIPVRFLAFDCLELGGEDLRALPLEERRGRLAALLRPEGDPLAISPLVPFSSWAELEREFGRSRELRVEGLMLKRRDAPYTGGRRRGAWWKWKLEPLSFDAVLVYAEPGHGRRAGLLTDYTFAVWDGDRLVPVAKAYSGLDEPSLEELDRWLRRNTLRRFGPGAGGGAAAGLRDRLRGRAALHPSPRRPGRALPPDPALAPRPGSGLRGASRCPARLARRRLSGSAGAWRRSAIRPSPSSARPGSASPPGSTPWRSLRPAPARRSRPSARPWRAPSPTGTAATACGCSG